MVTVTTEFPSPSLSLTLTHYTPFTPVTHYPHLYFPFTLSPCLLLLPLTSSILSLLILSLSLSLPSYCISSSHSLSSIIPPLPLPPSPLYLSVFAFPQHVLSLPSSVPQNSPLVFPPLISFPSISLSFLFTTSSLSLLSSYP